MVSGEDVLQQEYVGIAKEILANMGVIEFCACGATWHRTYNEDIEETEVLEEATRLLKEKYGENQCLDLWEEILQEVWDDAQDKEDCQKCSNDD